MILPVVVLVAVLCPATNSTIPLTGKDACVTKYVSTTAKVDVDASSGNEFTGQIKLDLGNKTLFDSGFNANVSVTFNSTKVDSIKAAKAQIVKQPADFDKVLSMMNTLPARKLNDMHTPLLIAEEKRLKVDSKRNRKKAEKAKKAEEKVQLNKAIKKQKQDKSNRTQKLVKAAPKEKNIEKKAIHQKPLLRIQSAPAIDYGFEPAGGIHTSHTGLVNAQLYTTKPDYAFHLDHPSTPQLFQEDCIQSHNKARLKQHLHGLVWDDNLAASAKAHVDSVVANGGRQDHLPSTHETPGNSIYGWPDINGYVSCGRTVESWMTERGRYEALNEPISAQNINQIGHYAQIMWTSTQQVGCAWAMVDGSVQTVCHYFPSGNHPGERPY